LHLDKVIGIFREISAPVVLVFDNIDDLLSGGTSCTDFRNLLDDFSESNDCIKILFTTRGLLQTTRGQVEGFKEFRIGSLSSASSLKFVRQLLPSFSECVVDRVVRISFHVPLAIKIVASSLVENSEDLANEMLDEFNFSESLLEQIDDHAFGEEKMKTIFESLFERLALSEKKAFIILTAFASAMISKDAAVDIISKEMGSKSKAVHSLNSLVKKAFVDKDVKTEYFSVHPLIYSFAINVAEHPDFKDVLSSSRMHFCEYYLHVFERLNDDFLAGKSIDSLQLEDTIQHLRNAILQSLTYAFENSTNVSRILSAVCGILSKSETFLFSMIIPGSAFDEIPKIYDLAIEKSETNSLSYLKLHVSKYFQNIAFSFFVKCEHAVDIPKSIRENINLLSDGTAAKLSCYQAIFDISSGYVERGVVLIEKCLSGLQKYPDQLLLKCMCLQILMIYNRISNQVERSLEFREMAFDACAEIGNPNLFLTDDCDHKADEVDESLILFNYLFFIWSKEFLPAEVKRHLCHSVYKIQQQKEAKVCCSPDYFNSIILYGDYLVTFLSNKPEQDVILNKRIQGLIDVKGNAASDISQQNAKMRAYLSGRLLFSHDLKIAITNDKEQNIEACRNALDSSIQHFGERHQRTAKCYYNIGLAQYNLENYTSALDSFDHALNILLGMSQEPDVFNILSDLYLEKGKTCEVLGDFEQAFSCYEEALTLQKSNTNNEESEKIAAILFSKGSLQYGRRDFTAALATLKHALRMRVNLFSEKRCSYMDLVSSYLSVGNSYYFMGDNTERESYFENALKILKSSIDGKYESEKFIIEKCVVYMQILHWKVDPNLSTEFLDRCIPLVKKHASCLLPILYMTVGFNQLESGKTKAGLTFIQNALDLGLDPIQQAHALIRGMTVTSYSKVVLPTIKMKEYKLAKKIIDRALHIAESVPEPEKPRVMLNCYFLRGCFYTNTQNYSSAIKSLRTALLHLSEDSSDSECAIRWNIAIAHDCQGSYKDALHELFFIIKNGLVEGSEKEGDTYCLIANISRKLEKSSLVAQNLQLAYNMYLKVLGKDHPKTRQCLVALSFDEQFSQYLHGEFAPG
jgi:tetratricopeptide (TPR) repeat protein